MASLKEKYGSTALVTGASSGIGEAFAREFARQQLDLVLVARRGELLNKLRDQLTDAHGIKVTVIAQDLGDAEGADNVVAQLECNDIVVDMLVNNAGFGAYGEVDHIDLGRQLSMIDLNCKAVVALTYKLLPAMKQRRRGAVITVSSALAYFPSCHFAVYSATKAFDLLFGEALYGELRPYGIDAIAIAPTLTETGFQSESRMKPMPIPMRKAEDVVRTCLRYLGKRASVVDGPLTRLGLLGSRLLPRTWLLSISRRFMSAPQEQSHDQAG